MLIIENKDLLHALLRALCTCKFDGSPANENVREVAGSPLVASVANQTYDALIAAYRREYLEGYAHALETRRDAALYATLPEVVQAHIRFARRQWVSWSRELKAEFVRILVSPYTAAAEFVDRIILEADERVNADQDIPL